MKKKRTFFIWYCGQDRCCSWCEDDTYCNSRSKVLFSTKEKALAAAMRHERRMDHFYKTYIKQVNRKDFPHLRVV